MQELPDTYTRADLVNQISGDSGLTRQAAGHVLDLIEAHVANALSVSMKVRLLGLGVLEVRPVAARQGIMNGRAYSTAASKKVVFKASKGLKAAINGN